MAPEGGTGSGVFLCRLVAFSDWRERLLPTQKKTPDPWLCPPLALWVVTSEDPAPLIQHQSLQKVSSHSIANGGLAPYDRRVRHETRNSTATSNAEDEIATSPTFSSNSVLFASGLPLLVKRDALVEPSLSALLPVHNAQSTLARAVLDLLDVLPDLTARCRVVIVDDCSSDDTIEVADELAACYPQVKAVRHGTRQRRPAIVATGLAYSDSEIVLLSSVDCTVASDEIRRLWKAIQEHDVVLGRATTAGRRPWSCPRTALRPDHEGLVMFHRRVSGLVRPHLTHLQELRNYLSESRLRWCDVEVRDRRPEVSPHPNWLDHDVRTDCGSSALPDRPAGTRSHAPRPNYVGTPRRTAFGE